MARYRKRRGSAGRRRRKYKTRYSQVRRTYRIGDRL